MALHSGVTHQVSEHELQINAVRELVQTHSLPKSVAEASVDVAGWWDIDLCLNWAHHYGKDKKLIKVNSERFLRDIKRKKAEVHPETLKSVGEADAQRKSTKSQQSGGKGDARFKRIERVVIFDKIASLLLQYHKESDELAALEKKDHVVENLTKFNEMDKKVAFAAVQAVGPDSIKCQKWAKEEYNTEFIDDLFWEYIGDAGAISHLKSKELCVDNLVKDHNVDLELAKAAVQLSRNDININKCLQWIKKVKKDGRNFASLLQRFTNCECPDYIVKEAKQFDSALENIGDYDKVDAAVDNLTINYATDSKVAIAAVESEGWKSVDQQLDWISTNQYDVDVVRDLYGEYLVQKCIFNEMKKQVAAARNIAAKYGIDTHFAKAFMRSVGNKSTENFLSWIMVTAKKIPEDSKVSFKPIEELVAKFDLGSVMWRKLEEKRHSATTIRQKYKVPTEVANACAQRCGTNDLECQSWIAKYQHDYNVVKFSLQEYESENEPYIALNERELAMTTLVENHRFDKKFAKAAVQLKGPDVRACKEWINAIFEKNAKTNRRKSEKCDMVQYLVEFLGLSWLLSSAAVQKCGHKNINVCLQWIDSNQSSSEAVGEAAWEYRFWEAADRLNFDRPTKTFELATNAVTPLEVTLSLLMEVYHFTPIIAQAAVSSQGWGMCNVQKCKEWAETYRENYALIGTSHNFLEKRLHEEILKTFNEKVEQKAVQKKLIYKEGGSVEVFGCSAEFTPDAINSNKGVEIEVSITNNPKKYPENCIPITPVFCCKPPMTFQKPVIIRMRTYYSALCGKKIPAKVLCRKNKEDPWSEIESITILDENTVSFEVWHFCGYNVAVSVENASGGEYHLKNDVFIQRGTAQIISVFTKDEKTQQDLKDSLKPQGYVEFLPVTNEINERLGVRVQLSLECEEPIETTIEDGIPEFSFRITRDFLKRTMSAVSFKMTPRPSRAEEQILYVLYKVSLDERRISLALCRCWPIELPNQSQAISITAPMYVSANQLAIGGGSIEVTDSTSVVSGNTLVGDNEDH